VSFYIFPWAHYSSTFSRLVTSLVIDLGSKSEDDFIITSANNPGAIPRDIRIANTTSGASSPTSRMLGTKHTSVAKKGSAKRIKRARDHFRHQVVENNDI
jgi:hypothetical protein